MLVFQLTGSGVGVAGTVAFEILPVLLLGPVAGLVADRYPRRRLVLADVARAALAALIAVSHTSTPIAYAVAFGLSSGSLLFNPAASSRVPELLDSDEDIVEANSALWTVAVAAQIILAPLAGGLIATVGVGWAFGVNAVSYLLSAALLWGLDAGTTPAISREAAGRASPPDGTPCASTHCSPGPRSSKRSPPSLPVRPAGCWWSSPSNVSGSMPAASASCSVLSALVPCSAPCCGAARSGLATVAGCSARSPSADWSTCCSHAW